MKNAATKFRPVSTLPSHSSALASSDRGALPPVVLFIWSLPKKLPGHEGPAFMSGTRRYFFEASFAVFRPRSRSDWDSYLSLLRTPNSSQIGFAETHEKSESVFSSYLFFFIYFGNKRSD